MRHVRQSRHRSWWPLLVLSPLLAACEGKRPEAAPTDTAYQQTLRERLLDAKPGEVIEIPAGRFAVDRSLGLRVDNVTLRGQGMGRTVLTFRDQKSGAEGLLVRANGFTLENLAIEDTKGDAVKVNEGERITFRNVRVEWTGGPKTTNGAYGLYPVRTRNVLIEGCVVIGASDAGIYVGQSSDIVVRRNLARDNVAGIEIENSTRADVYGNETTRNTGGILVFNMPNLPLPGAGTRVFDNHVHGNNTPNFGAKGSAVASIPAGSGIVINSNDQVEIFGNRLADNATAHVIVSSYYSTGYMNSTGVAASFDPYPEGIHIHGNRFQGGGDSPDGLELKALKLAVVGLGGALPPVLWDGYLNRAKLMNGQLPPELRLCVRDAGAVLNADGPGKYANPALASAPYDCVLAPLPPVELGRT
jgi:parallel beta-helix repeat protein